MAELTTTDPQAHTRQLSRFVKATGMRLLLLAALALAEWSLLSQAFTPGSIRSAALLQQPLALPRTKAILAQPLNLFPSAATASFQSKKDIGLSAVRVIPVSDASSSLWQRVKNAFSGVPAFFKDYHAFMNGDGRDKVASQGGGPAAAVARKVEATLHKPAFRSGLDAAATAFVADLMVGKELRGWYSLKDSFRPFRLLGVLSQYMISYDTNVWLDSKFPERNVKNMVIKGLLATLLLGTTDPVTVTKYPVFRGAPEEKLPGLKEFARYVNPLLRIASFALPLQHRAKVMSTLWAAVSVLWAKTWAKGLHGYEANRVSWLQPTYDEPF